MDGNGRWASRRLLPRLAGHRQGVETLRLAVKWALARRIPVLTVFAFSSENWNRPAEEVKGLMTLLQHAIPRELPGFVEQGVALRFVGERQALKPEMQALFERAEARTQDGARLVLNICFNYGGRWDIVQAAQTLAARGIAITEASMPEAMALAHVADPDLVIRTGGERRVSNFLLWQAAYAEWFFSDKPWPAFTHDDLDEALLAFKRRERRFGQTSEQVRGAGRDPQPAPAVAQAAAVEQHSA
ncbi:MAG: Ditrans,polycis-undecaprenyl-diphosphate synthase ((2E,6E)-farnesyl-diphosphate specific) [Paracidovorax wautersii]|uniref:Isoprenyl transferase n=1 Tax=Paracidovorax wautersii TaxID=1177982 RepID=A0A7V8JRT6_9BURK|nr:MAG: Ditrans,polycis-undecaprenyl-diphosphate synthase ((2E,6E)-farnesyl-diphosphate specific) [Paracidovorax wautersii]